MDSDYKKLNKADQQLVDDFIQSVREYGLAGAKNKTDTELRQEYSKSSNIARLRATRHNMDNPHNDAPTPPTAESKEALIRSFLFQPNWEEGNYYGQEKRRLNIPSESVITLLDAGCTDDDVRSFLKGLGISDPEVSLNDPRTPESRISSTILDISIADYNRFIRPEIPNIDQHEPVPLPDSYEEVTRAQIEAAKKLLFSPKWEDHTMKSRFADADDPGVNQKDITFSKAELDQAGVNVVVLSYVLSKVLKIERVSVGTKDSPDTIGASVNAEDYNKHIKPHIRVAEQE